MYNVHIKPPKKTGRASGNAKDAGLRRLRNEIIKLKDDGNLEEAAKVEAVHAEVIENKKSVNAALTELKIRRPMLQTYADDPVVAAQAIFNKYGIEGSKSIIAELQKLLG